MRSTKQAWCKRPVGKDHNAAERWLSLALVEIARLTAQRRLNLALAAVEQVLKLVRSELDDLRADHKLIAASLRRFCSVFAVLLRGGDVSAAPGPIAGGGLPILCLDYGAYWLVRRYRRKRTTPRLSLLRHRAFRAAEPFLQY
jgi:hypothetical protein